MAFRQTTGTVFAAALTVVAFGGAFLPTLHPLFQLGEGGIGSDDGRSLSGRFDGETLTDMTLRNCEVHNSELVRVRVYDCVLVGSHVVDSRVSGGQTRDTTASLTEFKNGRVEGGLLENVTVAGTTLAGTTVNGLIMTGGSLEDATVTGGTLENVAVQGGSLKWVTLRSTQAEAAAVAEGASIRESQVENYTLRGGDVTATTLVNTARDARVDVRDSAIQEAELAPRRAGRSGASLTATVENRGEAGAHYYEVVFEVAGRDAGRVLVKTTAPGASTSVAVPMPEWAASGPVTVTVDAGGRIPEPNEGDNSLTA